MSKRILTQTFGVAAAIIEKDGQILLIQENNKGHVDDKKWNQPAGWIEVGEDPIFTVKKEVKEEAGLDFNPTHLVGIYSLVREDIKEQLRGVTPHPLKFIFKGKFNGEPKVVTPDEISAVKWFDPEEINQMDLKTLRDLDIKQIIKDYFAGKEYSLDLITHTISK